MFETVITDIFRSHLMFLSLVDGIKAGQPVRVGRRWTLIETLSPRRLTAPKRAHAL